VVSATASIHRSGKTAKATQQWPGLRCVLSACERAVSRPVPPFGWGPLRFEGEMRARSRAMFALAIRNPGRKTAYSFAGAVRQTPALLAGDDGSRDNLSLRIDTAFRSRS